MITLPSAVLDTNIFISALIAPGNRRDILDLWSEKQFQFYISEAILEEIKNVGKRPVFRQYFTVEQLETLLDLIKQQSIFVPSSEILPEYQSRDDKDDIFVSCLLESRAAYFVTGNAKHFSQIKSLTHVVNPNEFINSFQKAK